MFRKVIWGLSRHGRKVFEKVLHKVEGGVPKKQPAEGVPQPQGIRAPTVAITKVQPAIAPRNQLVQVLAKYGRQNLAADLRRQFDKSPIYREYRGLASKLSMFAFVGVGFASTGSTEEDRFSSVCDQMKELFQTKFAKEENSGDFTNHGLQDYDLGPMIAVGCSAAVYQAKNKLNNERVSDEPARDANETDDDQMSTSEDVVMESDDDSDIEVISEDEDDSFSLMMDVSQLDHVDGDDVPESQSFEHVMIDQEPDDDLSIIDEDSTGCTADVMFLVTCQQDPNTGPSEDSAEILENRPLPDADFDLAIKMLFNYDTESNASALYTKMKKELLPLKVDIDQENLGEWENGHRAKEKERLPPHPNIVEMETAFVDDVPCLPGSTDEYPAALPHRLHPSGYGRNKTLFLVMKRYPQTLRDYLWDNSQVTTDQCLLLLAQLVEAVVHLGEHAIAHRDLKSDNIFVDDSTVGQPRLVVSDFGECLCVNKGDDLRIPYYSDEISKGGNMSLMAPEIKTARLGPKSVLDYTKADLWAVGALAYEIYGQPNPFYRASDGTKLDSDTYSEEDLPALPNFVPKCIQKVIRLMLQSDPAKRPTPIDVSTMLQIILWSPKKWLEPSEDAPSRREVMRWLLVLFAKVSCEKALGFTGVKQDLQRLFFRHLDFKEVMQALDLLRAVYPME